jgi:membrane protein implicated in regulation of membrane protease activity
VEGNRRVGRFGALSWAIIGGLAVLSVALIAVGYARMEANQSGGGTLLSGGLLFAFVDVALVVGLATTMVTRVGKRYHRLEGMVGEEGVVKETIPAGGKGVVLLRHELWSATSANELVAGTRVKIIKIEGILLHVEGS